MQGDTLHTQLVDLCLDETPVFLRVHTDTTRNARTMLMASSDNYLNDFDAPSGHLLGIALEDFSECVRASVANTISAIDQEDRAFVLGSLLVQEYALARDLLNFLHADEVYPSQEDSDDMMQLRIWAALSADSLDIMQLIGDEVSRLEAYLIKELSKIEPVEEELPLAPVIHMGQRALEGATEDLGSHAG